MKKSFSLFMLLVLGFSLFACTASAKPVENTATTQDVTEAPAETATPAPTATKAPEVIHFTDAYLEETVRTVMNRPEGDITVADAEALNALDLRNADWDAMNAKSGGIKDISDLKYFKNLTELHLDFNDVQDLSPLSTLTKLKTLSFSAVRVSDLSPLAALTSMVNLTFDWSYAPDQGFDGYPSIEFVRGMKELENFAADNAGIVDISPLATLPKLTDIGIANNQITDISPIAQIKTLKQFSIQNNPISDYSALEPYREVFPNLYPEFQPDVDLK